MPKLIRELRMGPTKSFKTGAVVGTYPKPMLVLMFDEGGIDIIPAKGKESKNPDDIKFDISAEDIVTVKPIERFSYMAGGATVATLPKVLCIDFCDSIVKTLNVSEYTPPPNSQGMQDTVDILNTLSMMGAQCPWKTIVIDPLTGVQNTILGHIAFLNPKALLDARQWAGMVGNKVQQIVGMITSFQAHVVLLAHTQIDKNEVTGAIHELPNVYGKIRESIGEYFSQFFYSAKWGTKPVIYSNDQGYVKGIGARWPVGLANPCNPDFQSIYGMEGLV